MEPARSPRPSPVPREQEQSIKDRKKQMFEEDEAAPVAAAPTKPFAEYLRVVPAAPLSPTIRAALWAAGVVVALLLVAVLIKGR